MLDTDMSMSLSCREGMNLSSTTAGSWFWKLLDVFCVGDGREDKGTIKDGPFEEAAVGLNASNSICAIAVVREGYMIGFSAYLNQKRKTYAHYFSIRNLIHG